jgi:hypothetical protein
MKIIAIPGKFKVEDKTSGWDIHKSGCRDIGSKYRGATYDDVEHLTVDTKEEIKTDLKSTDLHYFPCTKGLK